MDEASRTRLVALAVLLAVFVPLLIVAVSGSDSEDDTASLRVVRNPDGLPELILYVEDRALNRPGTAGGGRRVTVECEDHSGDVVLRRPERWPFADTDGSSTDPHAHVGVEAPALGRIARCRLAGTEPSLEGRVL